MSEPKFNSEDLGSIEILPESPAWRVIDARIRDMIETHRNELESYLAPEVTADRRGRIRALRTVLQLPEILRDEIRENLKEDHGE